MSKVMIHATVSVDGFMADADGGMDWMNGLSVAPQDEQIVEAICSDIGSIVGGANKTQTIEDGEIPYGGLLKVPVYLMTHREQEAIEQDGTSFVFVVDDIEEAVRRARHDAGDKWVSLLGGRIARQCLTLGLVDELTSATGSCETCLRESHPAACLGSKCADRSQAKVPDGWRLLYVRLA